MIGIRGRIIFLIPQKKEIYNNNINLAPVASSVCLLYQRQQQQQESDH